MKITEGKIKLIRDSVIIIIGALFLVYIAREYLLGALMPFIIAFVIALLVRGLGERVAGFLKLPIKPTRAAVAGILVGATLASAIALGYLVLTEAWQLIRSLGEDGAAQRFFSGIFGLVREKLGVIGISGELYDSLMGSVSEALVSAAAGLGASLSSAVVSVPEIILFIMVSVIATVYFSFDIDGISAALLGILPSGMRGSARRISSGIKAAMPPFLRSYLLIMLLTFAMMLAGLLILRVKYALLLAVVISIVDILPVLGIGIILVPWGIAEIIFGNAPLGIGLLFLFGIATVIRQIAEPKIVGKTLGINPLLSLFLMYAGYSLFGFAGLVILPALGAVILSAATSEKNIPPRSKSESDSGISDTAL